MLRQVVFDKSPFMPSKKVHEHVVAEVVQQLRAEREAAGLSLNTVSERAGLHQTTVGLIERGMRNPSLETLLRIAGAIDVNLAEILERSQRSVSK